MANAFFQQPLQPCRPSPVKKRALAPQGTMYFPPTARVTAGQVSAIRQTVSDTRQKAGYIPANGRHQGAPAASYRAREPDLAAQHPRSILPRPWLDRNGT